MVNHQPQSIRNTFFPRLTRTSILATGKDRWGLLHFVTYPVP